MIGTARLLRTLAAAVILFTIAGSFARAQSDGGGNTGDLESIALASIQARHPGEVIRLNGKLEWRDAALDAPAGGLNLQLTGEDDRGVAYFQITRGSSQTALDRSAQAQISFEIFRAVKTPMRRIAPGERLKNTDFRLQEINLTNPANREMRGNLVPADYSVTDLETKQTLLEGQPLLASSVQKVPDIRRGESVKVFINNNQIQLQTSGAVEENAYLNQKVRVLIHKTKRELSGILTSPGTVEVTL